jgi:glutathione S-transferase
MLRIYVAQISTYGRIVSTVAEAAGIKHETIPTDSKAPDHRARHPFMKTPAVEITDNGQTIAMYESAAICPYIDDVYNNGDLQPSDPLERARMRQWIAVTDHYVFPLTEERLVLPRIVVPMMGREPREDLIREALPAIQYYIQVVEDRLQETPFLAGATFSLADIFMYCTMVAVSLTPEGNAMLAHMPGLRRWMQVCSMQPCLEATRWPMEDGAQR